MLAKPKESQRGPEPQPLGLIFEQPLEGGEPVRAEARHTLVESHPELWVGLWCGFKFKSSGSRNPLQISFGGTEALTSSLPMMYNGTVRGWMVVVVTNTEDT